MTVYLTDVQVCLPGRGCVLYVPGAGQALNAAIAIGPRVLDVFFAVVLSALSLTAVMAAITALRRRRRRRHVPLLHQATVRIVAALLVGSGALGVVPMLVPVLAPIVEVLTLSASSAVGLALLVLGKSMPRVPRAVLTIAGGLRVLLLPVAALQFLLAAPLGSLPSHGLMVLSDLTLAIAGLVLLVTGRGFGAARWALLLLPIADFLCGIRLGLPFAIGQWIDLLPDVAVVAVGLLVLASPGASVSPALGRRRAAVQLGGTAAGLAVALVVLLAWPTSAASERAPSEPVIGPVRVVTSATALALPLDSYQQSFQDRALIIRAENTLIATCAARQGVSTHSADLLPAPSRESNSVLLGLIDRQQAATIGYWSPPAPESFGGVQSDEGLRVLAKCVRTAWTRLGDDGSAQQLVRETIFKALARADADSRVRRLQVAWSRCMQLRGFLFSTPTEVVWSQAMDFPTPANTRAASASVACERTTDLPGLRAAVLAAYEKQAIAQHGPQLTSARSALLAHERTADKILRATSPR